MDWLKDVKFDLLYIKRWKDDKESNTSINKFYSFIIFSLMINAAIGTVSLLYLMAFNANFPVCEIQVPPCYFICV